MIGLIHFLGLNNNYMENNFILVLIGCGIIWFLYLILKEIKIIRLRLIQWQLTWERRNEIDHSDVEDLIKG